jgi:hypothetical protein
MQIHIIYLSNAVATCTTITTLFGGSLGIRTIGGNAETSFSLFAA